MKRSIFIVCVLALFTCDASAAIKQGDYDYDFNFRWSSESGANGVADRDIFEIGLGVAKQVTRRIQLGIAVGHERREVGSIEDTVNYVDLKFRYHIFPDGLYVPYVGGLYRWFDRDRTEHQTQQKTLSRHLARTLPKNPWLPGPFPVK